MALLYKGNLRISGIHEAWFTLHPFVLAPFQPSHFLFP